MALQGSELTDEIQALVGRPDDTGLCDTTRITRWLNEAQRKIVELCPNLLSMSFVNTTSIDTTQVRSYDLAEVSVGDVSTQRICHLFEVYYLDGNESVKLPFVPSDEFDKEYPDFTHTDYSPDKPRCWTRRGYNIELYPYCATTYCDKDLRFVGDYYAEDLATDATAISDISNVDEGLIYYGVYKAWGAIGDEDRCILWRNKFMGWLQDTKDQNEELLEWEGNLLGDGIE